MKHCMIFAWRVVIHFKSKASFMYFFIVTAVVVMIYIYFFRTFALNFFAKNLVKCAKLPKNFQLHYYYFWNEKKVISLKIRWNMISFNHFSLFPVVKFVKYKFDFLFTLHSLFVPNITHSVEKQIQTSYLHHQNEKICCYFCYFELGIRFWSWIPMFLWWFCLFTWLQSSWTKWRNLWWWQ